MPYISDRLTRRRLLQGAAATWLLSISRVGLAADARVLAVRIWPASTYTRITLESNIPLRYKEFALTHPDRIVLDLEGVSLNSTLKEMVSKVQTNDPYLKQVRVGQFDQKTLRLVLELKQPVKTELFALQPVAKFRDRLVMDLFPAQTGLAGSDADPLLALLEEYNQGVSLDQEVATPPPATTGTKNRPFVVVLDPGHGGEDPGAIGRGGTREKDVVLQIARRLRKLIQQQGNMQVYMTRNEDIFIPLKVRVAKARKLKADLFVSIHADAFSNRAAKGSSVFALSKKGATSSEAQFLARSQNEADRIGGVSRSGDHYLDRTMFDLVQTVTIQDSLKLGQEVLSRMGRINTLHKRRVEQAGFAVLKAPDIPSILVETAFLSHPLEEQKLRTANFQQQIAEAILGGITAYARHIGMKR